MRDQGRARHTGRMRFIETHCALCLAETRQRALCPLCQRLCRQELAETPAWESPQPWPFWALGTFDGPLKALTLQLKHSRDTALGEWAGQAMARAVQTRARPDAITWVPGQWWNRWRRAGDPTAHIAIGLGRALNLPVQGLLHPKLAWHGKHRSKAQRRPGRFHASTQGCRRVWLVDDVLVTGNTLNGALEALQSKGLLVEEILVLAKG